jgi:hypothetical protein
MRLALAGIAASLVSAVGSTAEPCCMVPAGYEGSISQSGQEAVLLWHDGREELILKIAYQIKGAKMPDRFAWVITVPNEPEAYAVADAELFRQVHGWAINLVTPRNTGGSKSDRSGAVTAGLEFGQAVKVGPYDIQPVRALGREALDGLNAWLAANGFPTEDAKHMEYFVDNKFTFLCVKVGAPAGEQAVAPAAGLVPLHLSFRSAQPYYPLRFSSRQGVFDVTLYVLTKDHFDYRTSGDSLRRINWADSHYERNVVADPSSFPPTLAASYTKSAFKADTGRWHLNVLEAYGVNRGETIKTWSEDIFFGTMKPPSLRMGTIAAVAITVLVLGAAAILAMRRRRFPPAPRPA